MIQLCNAIFIRIGASVIYFMLYSILIHVVIFQIYERFDIESIAEADNDRLKYFCEKVCLQYFQMFPVSSMRPSLVLAALQFFQIDI